MRYVIMLLLLTASIGKAEKNCGRFYFEDASPIRVTTIERSVPSYIKSFRALVAHTPRQTKKLVTYRTKRIRPRVTWGAFGWDKAVATPRNKQQRELAKLFATGVERSSLGDLGATLLDQRLHWQFAREMRCLNRDSKNKSVSFGEVERLRVER